MECGPTWLWGRAQISAGGAARSMEAQMDHPGSQSTPASAKDGTRPVGVAHSSATSSAVYASLFLSVLLPHHAFCLFSRSLKPLSRCLLHILDTRSPANSSYPVRGILLCSGAIPHTRKTPLQSRPENSVQQVDTVICFSTPVSCSSGSLCELLLALTAGRHSSPSEFIGIGAVFEGSHTSTTLATRCGYERPTT